MFRNPNFFLFSFSFWYWRPYPTRLLQPSLTLSQPRNQNHHRLPSTTVSHCPLSATPLQLHATTTVAPHVRTPLSSTFVSIRAPLLQLFDRCSKLALTIAIAATLSLLLQAFHRPPLQQSRLYCPQSHLSQTTFFISAPYTLPVDYVKSHFFGSIFRSSSR